MLGKNKLEQAAFQPQQRNFGVLHLKHFRQYHADIERSDACLQHRSQGKQVFRENNFFKSSVFRLMGHKIIRTEFNLEIVSSLAL